VYIGVNGLEVALIMQEKITFYNALASIRGTGDLKTALGTLLQLAAESANSVAASLYVVDEHEPVLKPLATYGLPRDYIEACGNVPIGDQCCGRAVQYRKPWIVSDMLTDPLFASAREAALRSPIRAAFSVPAIDQDGRCLGSLACHYSEPHTPTAEDIERNQIWANMIASAIVAFQQAPLPSSAHGDSIPA
jgi:GAF domain-containing protein